MSVPGTVVHRSGRFFVTHQSPSYAGDVDMYLICANCSFGSDTMVLADGEDLATAMATVNDLNAALASRGLR